MTTSETNLITRNGTAEMLSVFGVGVQVLAGRAQTGGKYAAFLVHSEPGTGAPPHRHEGSGESFYVLDGEFDVMIEGEVHRLRAGDFAAVPPGVVHDHKCVERGRMLCIGVPGGHEEFFIDCAEAAAMGTFTPERGAQICRAHGIELCL